MSLANFTVPVLVGRYAGQQELGYYTLGLSVYVVVNALARSLVWTAYTKELHTRPERERASYTGSATAHLALYATAVALAMLVAAGAAFALGAGGVAGLFLVLAPVLALMLAREHVRRVSMAQLAYVGVFAFDAAVGALQVGLLVWLATSGQMSANAAFGAVAVSASLSLVWMLANRGAARFDARQAIADWRSNWGTSKWLSSAAAAVTLGNQGYRWVLPALTSVAELGRLGAAQLVVQVSNPIVIGLSNYLSPVTAELLASKGLKELWAFTLQVTLKLAAVGLAFVTLVGVAGVPVVCWLLQDAAEGVSRTLLVTLSLGLLSEALLMPIQAATVNRGRAKLLYKAAMVRLAVNLTLGIALVGALGAEGIGLGVAAGGLVALVWQWAAFAEDVRRA